jgi:hypothetical protein
LSVFIEFLQKIGYRQQVSQHLPVHRESPNALDPFLISVAAGAGPRRLSATARSSVGIEPSSGQDTLQYQHRTATREFPLQTLKFSIRVGPKGTHVEEPFPGDEA